MATKRPPIVCLIGSMRFEPEFAQARREETLAGRMVLGPEIPKNSDGFRNLPEQTRNEVEMLQLAKIQLADEVLVINPGGYIGPDTSREMAFAHMLQKTLRYWTPDGGHQLPLTQGQTAVNGDVQSHIHVYQDAGVPTEAGDRFGLGLWRHYCDFPACDEFITTADAATAAPWNPPDRPAMGEDAGEVQPPEPPAPEPEPTPEPPADPFPEEPAEDGPPSAVRRGRRPREAQPFA